ncbi:MAG: methyltransferase domain-containing protein [Methanoregulaceae archaeon]|nr:methyltransferase domain-containing protein [Methanoregulaceae archaeon]
MEKLNLNGDERVLDLGCGDGRITAEIAARLSRGSVVGIDSSPEMIRFARTHFPPEENPNLAFEMHDFRDLPVPGEFDIAFSNAALHWSGDQPAVLRGVRRNLVPGGRLLFQMGGKGNASRLVDQVLPDIVRRPRWSQFLYGFPVPYYFFGDTEYSGFLVSAGLVPLRVELIPKEMTYPGPDGLAGWVRTTWLPVTERVPRELRGSFISEIVEHYLSMYPPDPDGAIKVPMVRLEVEAMRKD